MATFDKKGIAAMFTVAQQRRLCDASICPISGNLITGEVVYETENVRLAEGCD